MPRARTAASILIVSVVLALAGCGVVPEPMPTPTPTATPVIPTGDGVLRVATVLSSADATSAARVAGVEVAVRELNEAGGWGGAPVQVIHRNAGDDAAATVAGLAGLGVDVVVGSPNQGAAVDAAALEAGSILISPTTLYGSASGGGELDELAIAQLLGSDPGLTDFSGAAGARDAVIAAALSATVSNDDGGASIASQLRAVMDGEVPCGAYSECLEALDAGYSVAFTGWSAPTR